MKYDFYWCKLQRSNKHTCGYIEAKGADLGKQVEMVDIDGEFWEVTSVGHGVTKSHARTVERKNKDFTRSIA